MKIRLSIIVLLAIGVVLTGLLIWYGPKHEVPPSTSATATNASPDLPMSRGGIDMAQSSNVFAHSNPTETRVAHDAGSLPSAQLKEDQLKEGLAALNDEEVVLYGKVVDQSGASVPGAAVQGSVQVNSGERAGVDRFSLTSDANGEFKVSGFKGKALGINVSKPGYALATTNTRFVYSRLWPESERHVPDERNPVLIKMWKMQGAEPLMGIDRRYKLPVTGNPANLDFTDGKILPMGGDLKLTVARAAGIMSGRNRLDWSVKIEAVDGGLIKTSMAESRVTFQAPEIGYESQDLFTMSTNAPNNWFEGFDQMYFMRSRGGQVFSKVLLSFNINENPDEPMSVMVRGVANTNGSRNWEATKK